MKKKKIYKLPLILAFCFLLTGCEWLDEESDETVVAVNKTVMYEEEKDEGEIIIGEGPNISFDTVDVYGNPVSSEMLSDHKLIMLNLWEPWCGPCVNEMPDLNYLYEEYKDKGLLIIGAYTTFDMDQDARDLVEEIGITYPIIKANASIYDLEQGYVPATYLLDNQGNLITDEPFAGANSYEGWEEIINEFLN